MEPKIRTLAKYYELTYAISIDSFGRPCGRCGGIQFFPLIIRYPKIRSRYLEFLHENWSVKMLKVAPHSDYPPEDGRYIRGNDASPVAVAIILNHDADKIPPEIEILVRTGIESGAALSGTIQTENIGFEKVVCNIVANPNIRYMIVGGPESEGHLTGDALKALIRNGVNEKMRIRDTSAPHPFLYNLPVEFIDRFRKQLSVIDLQFEGNPELIRKAVWSCYQENAVEFKGYSLFDPGAFPEQPLAVK